MAYYLTNDELYHHGILGQKWGIRRFQNRDGTYTSAGKHRRQAKNFATAAIVGIKRKYDYDKISKYTKDIYDHMDHDFKKQIKESLRDYEAYDKSLDSLGDKALLKQLEDNSIKSGDKANSMALERAKEFLGEYADLPAPYAWDPHNTLGNTVADILAGELIRTGYTDSSKYTSSKVGGSSKETSKNVKDNGFSDEYKKYAMERAKKDDVYNLDFLEFVQNKEVLDKGGASLQKAYADFLNNPTKFIEEDVDKLKDRF